MRHNAICDVLFEAAQSAALAPIREDLEIVADSRSRSADILLPTWHHGRPAAPDVYVISPLQDLTIHEAAVTPGHVLNVGIQRKLTFHLASCLATGVEFIPFVAEALGCLAEDTISIIRTIGKVISQSVSPDNSTITNSHLSHRLAISLCLWNLISSP